MINIAIAWDIKYQLILLPFSKRPAQIIHTYRLAHVIYCTRKSFLKYNI